MSGVYRMLAAAVLLTAGLDAVSPAPVPSVPPPRPLPDVVVNDVLFNAVEYGTTPLPWRNLAITIKADRLATWVALPQDVKDRYAQTMIDLYRAGLHYTGNVKLSFIDEQKAIVTQYVWTPPASPNARPR